MVFLIIAVFINLCITFTVKTANEKNWNVDNITLVNYAAAAVVSFLGCVAGGTAGAYASLADFSGEFVRDVPSTMFIVVALGTVSGVLYLMNLLCLAPSIRDNGAAVSTLFWRSSFVITIAVSVAVLGESLSLSKAAGVALALFALALVSGAGGGAMKLKNPGPLAALVIMSAVVEINSKLFSAFCLPEYNINMSFQIFAVALTACAVRMLIKRKKGETAPVSRQEIIAGVIMGVPNAFINFTLVSALMTVPAGVTFPTLAAGNLLLTLIISRFAFKEQMDKRRVAAIFVTTASLVLVNMS
ncbi:MAG: hypothetical protein LBK41_05185 [Clostridiales bacterium]|jgi:drug/metabolite transporter (DMT)-like permease|nr:hypothetical protein [Clostridiales bacterium]